VRRDVGHLLVDGQQGFADLAKRAVARDHAQLPPGERER
jgi:hypothetical protein